MNQNEKEYLVEKIRTQYTEKEYSELDALKALDKKVKKPAHVFAYTFGTIAALIMGSGMSLIMTEIGETIGFADPMFPGLVIGIIGLFLVLINYPIYKRLLNARRKKYQNEIISLSDKILRA